MRIATCVICSKSFETNKVNAKICSNQCRKVQSDTRKQVYRLTRKLQLLQKECPTCLKLFNTLKSQMKFCSQNCREISTQKIKESKKQANTKIQERLKRVEITTTIYRKYKTRLKNFYVYGWRQKGEKLPFYIGKGKINAA